MNRIATLINQGEHRHALVRLWVLAGELHEGTSRLNTWERGRDRAASAAQVKKFRADLQSESPISGDQIDAAPLAFVAALDEVVWLSGNSRFHVGTPIEEEHRGYWLVPLVTASREQTALAGQTGNPEASFKRHSIVPVRTLHGIEVGTTVARGRLADSLARLVSGGSVTMLAWLAHFRDEAKLKFDKSPAGRFRLQGVDPAASRADSIRESLQRASDCGSHIVLMPEFTVDLDGRKVVERWLVTHPDHPFRLVVAGSFHENTRDGWFNTAELWNHLGEPVLTHRKLRLFGEADGLAEDVKEGKHLQVLVSPIGTLALLICKDFLDEHQSVVTLLQEVPVEWVLVPSYGGDSTVRGHRRRAEQLATKTPGISSVIANQRNVELEAGPPLPGFALLAPGGVCQDVDATGGQVRLEVAILGQQEPPPPGGRLRILKK